MIDQFQLSLAPVRSDDSHNAIVEAVPDIPIVEFVSTCPDASVRLMNAVRAAAHDGNLPFQTISEYLAAGQDAIDRMLKLPNLGRKSVSELDNLVHAFITAPPQPQSRPDVTDCQSSAYKIIPIDFDISLDEFLNRQVSVSTRLFNAISTAVIDGVCPFSTVAEYVRSNDGFSRLCRLLHIGKGSVVEFDDLVNAAILRGSSHPIVSNPYIGANGWRPNIETLMQAVFSALEARELEILLDHVQSAQTLEQVGANQSLTRERVRQIESRAFKRLRRAFDQNLQECIDTLCNKLARTGIRECVLTDFSEIASCDVMSAKLFFGLIDRLDIPNAGHLVLQEENVFLKERFIPQREWGNAVKQALLEATWPLKFDDFLMICNTVPRFFIESFLTERYDARILDGEFEVLPALSTTEMCIHVLLKAGKPLHISEICALVPKYFDKDISEHLVTATVGRLKEVAIADSGTYVHYSCLSYSDEVLSHIRTVVYRHLAEQNCFIGSKVLFDRLFAKHACIYPQGFNHYLMMGIVQDDERFITKRGNMVGLRSFDVDLAFVSLEDEIRNMVMSDGPISIPEIISRLSATRKLCNDSGIRLILANTPAIIQVGPRTFDSLHRFFTSREEYDDLVTATEVNLLRHPKSIYALSHELIFLGFSRATEPVIESLINTMQSVKKVNDAYQCYPSQKDLIAYRDISENSFLSGHSRETTVRCLQEKISIELAEKLVRFDYRFSGPIDDQNDSSEISELSAILGEFDF